MAMALEARAVDKPADTCVLETRDMAVYYNTFRAVKNGRVETVAATSPINRKTFYVEPNSYIYVPYQQQ